MCNQIGEAVGRIYLNIGQEDIEGYLANHPGVLQPNADEDVFDFPRFQVRMFVNQGGLYFASIPPPDEDEYIDDESSDGFTEVDWAVPHLELRVQVNQEGIIVSRYIDNGTDDDTNDDASDESSSSSDEEIMFHQ